jgi:hypothetical protein
MNLKTSINIKYDYSDTNLLNDYYPTLSHTQIFKNILNSINRKSKIHAHIAYGPYGSGKSMVATILTQIISQLIEKDEISKFSNKVSHSDVELSELILQTYDNHIKYLPVVINGFHESFERTILDSIYEVIKTVPGMGMIFPGLNIEILKIIERWKTEYVDAYNMLQEQLISLGYDNKVFIDLIANNDYDAVTQFELIYSKITFGSKIEFFSDTPLLSVLENVLNKLKDKNLGLFIVYDEFGRMLQSINDETLNKFMSLIQDLAELASNGSDNFVSLYIAHKPLSYYFSFASKENRSEFAKVEKRFNVNEIKSDYTTFIHIATEFTKEITEEKKYLPLLNEHIFNIFKGIVPDEVYNYLLLNSIYPIHPVTLYLLPLISKVFGQNERTLFTFLKDESINGLLGHTTKEKGWYTPDKLNDYFFINIDESYVEHISTYKVFLKNLSEINSLIKESEVQNALKVYKFMMVWTISNNDSNYILDDKLISESLEIDVVEVKSILKTLFKIKKVRYNELLNKWEIFQGSSINVESLIKEELGRTIVQNNNILEFANEINQHHYIYPIAHNTKYEITRFSEVKFFLDSIDYSPSNSNDLEIPLFFTDDIENVKTPYGIIKYSYNKYSSLIKRVFALNSILENKQLLNSNKYLDTEIEYELEVVLNKIKELNNKILFKNTKYYYENKVFTINSLSEFEDFVNELINRLFDRTLYIVNDQINMFKLTKIQSNSIISVLDNVLNDKEENLDKLYNGSKPADLIYHTVLKDLVNDKNNSEILKEIKNELVNYIQANTHDKLSNLVKILTSPPYGLRPEISILILFKLISEQYQDMLLFSNESFIPTISTSELVSTILEKPDLLYYTFSVFDNSNREKLETLENTFKNIPTEVSNKSLSIRVCAGMYEWYINLPVITQQFDELGLYERMFLKVVSSSRINPQEALEQIIEQGYIEQIENVVNNIEIYLDQKLQKLENRILRDLSAKSLNEWAKKQDQIYQKSNKFVKLCLESSTPILDYSNYVENIEMIKWTRSSFDKLYNMIKEDIIALNQDFEFDVLTINGKESQIQTIDLSIKAKTTLMNLENVIDATRKYYSDLELEKLLVDLIKKYIK